MKGKLITTDASEVIETTRFNLHSLLVKAITIDSGLYEFYIYVGGNLRIKLANTFVYGEESPLNTVVQFGGYNFFVMPFYYGNLLIVWNAEVFLIHLVVDERNWDTSRKLHKEFMPTLRECASYGMIPWKIIKLAESL